ncbi:MAG: hypothetical protein MMC33_005929 [Icmadophila ericetorum]|nr:hypothetical protein [Icmadophila ericetorum]
MLARKTDANIVSGETPQAPVVSKKSGHVFERHLIESYISENGTDPVTKEELTLDDLVEVKSARVVRPRPPTLTSIPSLLSAFQNEWDALALETYTLRQQLAQTRQELSTALYQHDAAVRVIARISRERDEARDALSKITVNGASAGDGYSMQVDSKALSEALTAKVEATRDKLSKTRRKRAVPEEWATADNLNSFAAREGQKSIYPGSRSIALNLNGELVLGGGTGGVAEIFSRTENRLVQTLHGESGTITDSLWIGGRAAIATSTGMVKIYDGGSEVSKFSGHSGEATALAAHPSGDILASVGVDKSYILYDLTSSVIATQVYTNAVLVTVAFHPDGHLLAAGGIDGQIKVFDVKTGAHLSGFDLAGPVQCVEFSENGTWLAASVKGDTSISIWDLRKNSQIKVLDIGSPITSLRWDYTGQFLAAGGPSGLAVQQYSKASKDWSEPLRHSTPAVAVEWGPNARSLLVLVRNSESVWRIMETEKGLDCFSSNRKRTHEQITEGNNGTSSSRNSNQPAVSIDHGFSPPHNELAHFRLLQPPYPRRFVGDGLDLRRPVMSTSSNNVIDLTGEPDSPQEIRDSADTGSRAISNRAHRPPRFARDIIDLEAETSPDIEVIGSGPSGATSRPQARAQEDTHRGYSRTDGVAQYVPTLRPVTAVRNGIGVEIRERRLGGGGAGPPLWQYFTNIIRGDTRRTRTFELQGPAGLLDLDDWHTLGVPDNTGQFARQMYRNRENVDLINDTAFTVGNDGFQLPTLDFEIPAFQMGDRASMQPQGYAYEAPGPARVGYTRSPQEDQKVVCPNCDEELGVGDTDLKRQVWVVKSCGHV